MLRRRWWRWILAAAVIVVLALAGTILLVSPQAGPAPLALPRTGAGSPAGPAAGTWQAVAGSLAGFRVRETFFGKSDYVVGRTDAVTGTITISGDRVTAAAFTVSLASIKVRGKSQPQFAASLGTRAHPSATFTLTRPVALPAAFFSGAAVAVAVAGQLGMNGTENPVSFAISGRRDGPALEVTGSIGVVFAKWDIKGPAGYGFIASLDNHGSAEFLIILRRP